MKVYLNAGHDRQLDPGAVNRRLNLRECDAAYELALGVQQYLERNGIAVVFGQDDDLYRICDQANQAECDLFVSIHFNAYNGRASGTETLISGSTGSLMLGHCIQTNLKAVLNLAQPGTQRTAGTLRPAQYHHACRPRRSLFHRQRLRLAPLRRPSRRSGPGHRDGHHTVPAPDAGRSGGMMNAGRSSQVAGRRSPRF